MRSRALLGVSAAGTLLAFGVTVPATALVSKKLIHKGFRRLTLDGAQQIPSARGNKSAGGIGASLTLTPRLAADSVTS